jgi:hypothetical protein
VNPNIEICPISQKAARSWTTRVHRHHRGLRADLFRSSLCVDGEIVAVGVCACPARLLQDGRTVCIARIASEASGPLNANSRLYSSLIRAGRALGYRRFVTYSRPEEPGTSLRAFGFEDDGLVRGGEYTRPSRTRPAAADPGMKRRWLFPTRDSHLWDGLKKGAK